MYLLFGAIGWLNSVRPSLRLNSKLTQEVDSKTGEIRRVRILPAKKIQSDDKEKYMVETNEEITQNGTSIPENQERTPKSLAYAQKGIHTSQDFASTMSALMSDLLEGAITPEIGNAVCNAGGKLLKVVEMQYKYGAPPKSANAEHSLLLAPMVVEESS